VATRLTEILAAAPEVSADLIAMSTHGRSGFTRLLFGSGAEAVLRQSEYPVFLMRVTAGAHTEPGGEVLKATSSGSLI
jgi:nucleotide-binding universal stress UspA family protein